MNDSGKQTVMNFVMNDGALSVCDGMANTIKHHTRKPTTLNPDPVTARIAAVSGGRGVRAEIEWSRPSGVSGSDDAQDLARRCVAAWESFFQMHTLNPSAL